MAIIAERKMTKSKAKTFTEELIQVLADQMIIPQGEEIVLRHEQPYSLSGRTTDAFCVAAFGDSLLEKNPEASLLHHAIQDALLEKFSFTQQDPYNSFRSFFGYPSVMTIERDGHNAISGIALRYTGDRMPPKKWGVAEEAPGISLTSEGIKNNTERYAAPGIRCIQIADEALVALLKRADEIIDSKEMQPVISRICERSGLLPCMALTAH